jgi:hypothetical protein
MYDNMSNFFHTSKRVFAGISQIDLWHSDSQACLYLDGGDRRVYLDSDETSVVRKWAELALQASVADIQDLVILRRCELVERQQRARKLNHAADMRAARRRRNQLRIAHRPTVIIPESQPQQAANQKG